MPTTIDSAGITFTDTTSLTSANIGTNQIINNAVTAAKIPANAVGATQIANGSVTAAKLGTNEQKQIAKAWVNFNGTGTIGASQAMRSSFNVSSVTKNGNGDYTVNFPVGTFADANYAACVSFGDLGNNTWASATNIGWSISTTSIRIRNMNVSTPSQPQDGDQNFVVVFGN